jgi:PAS domain S-box-containing protein
VSEELLSSNPTRALHFLSEASRILSATLDLKDTLYALSRLVVPQLADWCDISLLQPDESIRRVYVHHSDPAKVALAEEHYRRYPYQRSNHPDLPRTLRDGRAWLMPEVQESMLQAVARDEGELAILRQFAMKSNMVVPLIARRRILGIMSLATAESGRVFSPTDVSIAESLSARAALAIDNARLFQAEREARGAAEAQVDALRSSRERFEKVFHASPISISINRVDDGRFVDVNQACEELTGYKRLQMIGKSSLELGLWITEPERNNAIHDLITNGKVRERETRLRNAKGEVRDVLMSLELIELDGVRCNLAMAQDVTELKRITVGLERVQKMEALGRLAGGIAHDFNNILTAVNGYVSLAVESLPTGSPARSTIEQVQRSTRRAASLTQQLLLFGRQKPRQPGRVDLNATIVQLLPMLRRLIGEDVQLSTALQPELHLIDADPSQLEQVIVNLAINARDAMPSGGKLHLSTCDIVESNGGLVVQLTVEDDGMGMDEDTRARIFEPFFTTKAVGKGTGLGLATVYSVVEQHGGRISVSSAPGQGARFELRFPSTGSSLVPAPTPGPVVLAPSGKETILVVEDDESVLGFVCLVLEQRDYRVLTAPDGESALHVAGEHAGTIDLLLTDIVMPQLNGRALANELRKRLPNLRVMYMSGYPGDTIDRYGEIPEGDPFLQKPFTRDQLLTRVAAALEPR